MTDHQFFIWGAYGLTAVVLALEVAWLGVRAAKTRQTLRESRQLGEP